jgi:hypothetical protein
MAADRKFESKFQQRVVSGLLPVMNELREGAHTAICT